MTDRAGPRIFPRDPRDPLIRGLSSHPPATILGGGIVRIGIDVGGTNTDAVIMDGTRVVAAIKTPTTANVSDGITTALRSLVAESGLDVSTLDGVMIGTTHFTNAVVERTALAADGLYSAWPAGNRLPAPHGRLARRPGRRGWASLLPGPRWPRV